MRDDVQCGVDPTEDSIRAQALDQRDFGDTLDRLGGIAEQLREEDHRRGQEQRALGERREYPDDRGECGAADERWAKPEALDHPRREERTNQGPDAAGRDDDSEQERAQVQFLDQEDRVENAIEGAGHVGDDRARRERQEDAVATYEPQPFHDLGSDRRDRVARGPRRLGSSDQQQRDRRPRVRHGVDQDRKWGADQLDEPAGEARATNFCE